VAVIRLAGRQGKKAWAGSPTLFADCGYRNNDKAEGPRKGPWAPWNGVDKQLTHSWGTVGLLVCGLADGCDCVVRSGREVGMCTWIVGGRAAGCSRIPIIAGMLSIVARKLEMVSRG